MKYMLMIFQNPATWETVPEDERNALMEEAGTIMNELMEAGEWIGGEALADPSMSKTVRVRAGVPAVTDGPFIESKEQLVGYCIFECESEERAIEIGTRWPDAKLWAIELRPLMSQDGAEM